MSLFDSLPAAVVHSQIIRNAGTCPAIGGIGGPATVFDSRVTCPDCLTAMAARTAKVRALDAAAQANLQAAVR